MKNVNPAQREYDYVIIGSGFGGSVSAYRLSQKGYRVLVIEKGKWYRNEDFPKSNWNLKRWLWIPQLKLTGIMRLSIFRYVSILSGVGVGGGSLVYAATLPVPKPTFFKTGSWAGLKDWENVLKPFYDTAYKMLGAGVNTQLGPADLVLKQLAQEIGQENEFHPAKSGIYFAKPGQSTQQSVPDPFFDGAGPSRTPCRHCGQCMTGCRYNSKNSLDKNYLFLAQNLGAEIQAESFVYDVKPSANGGYDVYVRDSLSWFPKHTVIKAKGVVFAGGVLGTVKLLLSLKKKGSLPKISDRVGHDIRTNNECLILVPTSEDKRNFSEGLGIGSVLHTDEHSHLEPCRYGEGSGFWRLLVLPMAYGSNFGVRMFNMFKALASDPLAYLKIARIKDYAKSTPILLFMQHLDGTIQFSLDRMGFLSTRIGSGSRPIPYIARAKELAEHYARLIKGKPFTVFAEQVTYTPSTAHILGGAVMGDSPQSGVIDAHGKIFGYDNLLVCDGSIISANPGVNPSLSITAISEYIMSLIPNKSDVAE